MKFAARHFPLILILLLAKPYPAACQNNNDSMATSSTYSSPYHLSWVWPDSLPKLQLGLASYKDSMLFVIGEDGALYCLTENGDISWIYHGDYGEACAPTVSDTTVYFIATSKKRLDDFKFLYAIDIDGKLRWIFKSRDGFETDPIISPQGDIFIQAKALFSDRRGVYQVSKNGKGKYEKWPKEIYHGWILGFDTDRKIIALDGPGSDTYLLSDKFKVLQKCPGYGRCSVWLGPSNLRSKLLYCNKDDFIIAKALNCETIWDIPEGTINKGKISYHFIGDNNAIFIGTDAGEIFKIRGDDGALIWKCDIGIESGGISGLAFSGDGTLLVTGSAATLAAIDSSGKLSWEYMRSDPGVFYGPLISLKDKLFLIRDSLLCKFSADTTQIFPQPEAAPSPASSAEAEKEVADFMLHEIIRGINNYADKYSQRHKIDINYSMEPADMNLIIYASADSNAKDNFNRINMNNRIAAYLYGQGRLFDAEDTIKAIEANPPKDKWFAYPYWSLYDTYAFGIKSISQDNQWALVYLDHHCGDLCGRGFEMYLKRSRSGKWWIYKRIDIWIS
jgi:outer membrane protein assembly factor BamB